MSQAFATVAPTESAAAAAERLRQSRGHGLVVLDGGWPVGVFTRREALEAETAPDGGTVERWSSSAFLCVPGELPCFRAAAQAVENATRHLVVVDQGQVVGLLMPRELLTLG
jgi:CBS domain-containing protein